MKIYFDINGNDNGPQQGYEAAYTFAKNNPNIEITLVGEIQKITHKTKKLTNLKFVENTLQIEDPHNLKANLKLENSINYVVNALKNNEADAILSSSDSGNYVASLTLNLGRLDNIKRPAFMPMANAINGSKVLILDVGANLEVKPEFLYQWALIANVFYRCLYGNVFPKITLLNIGTEAYKGITPIVEADKLLRANSNLNYIGYSETRDILKGEYQIAVIDGYGGNLVLKSYEGALTTFASLLKHNIKSRFIYKIAGLMLKPALNKMKHNLDYKNVGAAWVIGVNGLAIKTHGSSDKTCYLFALEQLKSAYEKNLLENIKNEIKDEIQDNM